MAVLGKKLKLVAARCQAVAAGRITGRVFLAIRHEHRELHNLRPVMLITRSSHCSKTVTQPLVELLHIAGFGVEVAFGLSRQRQSGRKRTELSFNSDTECVQINSAFIADETGVPQ